MRRMAEIACVDSREGNNPNVFYDGTLDEKRTLVIERSSYGRGIAIANGIKKLVVTDDVVVACCYELAVHLGKEKKLSKQSATKDQVRTVWARITPVEHRAVIERIKEEKFIVDNDTKALDAVKYLCLMCIQKRAKQTSNLIILDTVEENNYNAV